MDMGWWSAAPTSALTRSTLARSGLGGGAAEHARLTPTRWPRSIVRALTSSERGYGEKDSGPVGAHAPDGWRPRGDGHGAKRRVNDLPTGAARLDSPAVGVHGLRVNSVGTVDDRDLVKDRGRPGRVLREFAR